MEGTPTPPGAPGGVSSSLIRSARHRVLTRLRLLRMRPRRARAVAATAAELAVSASGPATPAAVGDRRVLAVLHVFYPDLWAELAAAVARVPEPVDLVVTLVRGVSEHVADDVAGQFPGAVVRIVDNRGRDIWPLVQVLDLLPGHDVVLKLHTKRSPQLPNGDVWRRELLDGLCGSGERIAQTLELLRTQRRVGMVAPDRNVLGREFLGGNRARLRELARVGGIPITTSRLWFPAGSMFWTRAEVLAELAALDLSADSFEPEAGVIDGTTAHALERYLGVILAARGLAVVETREVGRLLALTGG